MAGSTTSNFVSAPLTGDAVTKGATIPQVIFNDTNGPRPFINTVQVSLFAEPHGTKISFSFNTDGELGGGIDTNSGFRLQVLHQGNVIYTTAPFEFAGPCRDGHSHPNSGVEDAPLDIYAAADAVGVAPMTVNVYPC
jgi:hypothetical protein